MGNTQPAATGNTGSAAAQQAAPAEPVGISGYQTVSEGGMSCQLPNELEELDAGAAEIQLCYTYPDDLSGPYICVQLAGGGLPTSKVPAGKGIMSYASDG